MLAFAFELGQAAQTMASGGKANVYSSLSTNYSIEKLLIGFLKRQANLK